MPLLGALLGAAPPRSSAPPPSALFEEWARGGGVQVVERQDGVAGLVEPGELVEDAEPVSDQRFAELVADYRASWSFDTVTRLPPWSHIGRMYDSNHQPGLVDLRSAPDGTTPWPTWLFLSTLAYGVEGHAILAFVRVEPDGPKVVFAVGSWASNPDQGARAALGPPSLDGLDDAGVAQYRAGLATDLGAIAPATAALALDGRGRHVFVQVDEASWSEALGVARTSA